MIKILNLLVDNYIILNLSIILTLIFTYYLNFQKIEKNTHTNIYTNLRNKLFLFSILIINIFNLWLSIRGFNIINKYTIQEKIYILLKNNYNISKESGLINEFLLNKYLLKNFNLLFDLKIILKVETVLQPTFIGIILTILTCFISTVLILWIWDINTLKFDLLICILLTQLFLINTFLTNNLLLFFIFFEASALPLIYIIGNYGPTFRKIKALYYYIGYTIFGSCFLIIGILLVYKITGSFNINKLYIIDLMDNITFFQKSIIWFCFFIGFAVKVPIMPFHLWLLEAHVEAPTVGSVILAALLLKVGGYGIYRICIIQLYNTSYYYAPFILIISSISLIFASISIFLQLDIKRIIAYSSIIHMNAGLVGLFSFKPVGEYGFICGLMSHGFISSGLFFLAGTLYKKYHMKNILQYSGLGQHMPLFSFFLLMFCFSNVAFPGTFNFISELFVILSISQVSLCLTIFLLISSALTAFLFIWLFVRICWGEPSISVFSRITDIDKNISIILLLLLIPTLIFGLCPNLFTDSVILSAVSCKMDSIWILINR